MAFVYESNNLEIVKDTCIKVRCISFCDEFGTVVVYTTVNNGFVSRNYYRYKPIYEYSIWTKSYEFVTNKLEKLTNYSLTNIYNVLQKQDDIVEIEDSLIDYCDDCRTFNHQLYESSCCCLYKSIIKKVKIDKMAIHDYKQLVERHENNIREDRKRSVMLLFKLKYIINELRNIRLGSKELGECIEMSRIDTAVDALSTITACAEMDSESSLQTDNELHVDKQQTTILTTNSELNEGTASCKESTDMLQLASCGDGVKQFKYITDRWVPIYNFDWKDSHTPVSNLMAVNFMSLLTKKGQANTPLYNLMSMFTYLKCDLEFRIHVNSTKFHIGQLLFGFYYSAAMDSKAETRYIPAGIIQLPHVKVNANTANDAILRVPFKYYKSMVCLKSKPTTEVENYGTLVCRVLSKLNMVSGSSNTVKVNLYVRLVNAEFSGLNVRSFQAAEAEMMSIKKAINLTSDTLDFIMPDDRRDAPPNDTVHVRNIPHIASNWNAGSKSIVDAIPMRMNEIAQTPHPPGTTNQDDVLDILDICKKPGLYHQVEWTNNHGYDSLIFSDNVSPMSEHTTSGSEDLLFVSSEAIGSITKKYKIMPPIYNVMSCFSYWRGSLIYDFEVICSDFHTGSFLCAFIPGLTKKETTNFNIDLMKSCYCATFDIREKKNFSFVVPYIADKPWWPRSFYFNDKYNLTYREPLGTLIVRVINPMVISNTVPNHVDVNIYIRAGDDFECSVLSQPVLSLNYDLAYSVQDLVFIKDGYYPDMWCDTWHYLPSNKFCLRYGEGSDHITQFTDNMEATTVYKCMYSAGKIYCVIDKKVVPITHIVCLIVNGDKNKYRYATGFVDYKTAAKFATSNSNWSNSDTKLMTTFSDAYQSTEPLGNIYFQAVTAVDFEFVEAEMDTEKLDTSTSSLLSTGFGKLTFGESFSSIKDMLRRYNWEADLIVPIVEDQKSTDYKNLASLQIPISLSGLSFDGNDTNRVLLRHNTLTYLLSCFRFGRGGIRYRLVFPIMPITVHIQHVVWPTVRARTVTYAPIPTKSYEDYIKSGYTLCVQNLSVNNIVSIEIPYYSPGSFIVNGVPNIKIPSDIMHHTLGQLLISVDSNKALRKSIITTTGNSKGIPIKVYKAVADDFSPSCYVGFPPCIQNIEYAKAEMDDEVQPEMMGMARWMVGAAVDPVSTGGDLLKGIVKEASEDIKDTVKQVVSEIKEDVFPSSAWSNLTSIFPEVSRTTLVSAIVTILNCAINPNVRTFVLNIVSFFVQVGILAAECVTAITSVFVQFINNMIFKSNNIKKNEDTAFSKTMKKYKQEPYKIQTESSTNQQSQVLVPNKPIRTLQMGDRTFRYLQFLYQKECERMEKQESDGEIQPEGPDCDYGSLVSVCVSGVLTAFSMKNNLLNSSRLPNFSNILLRDIKDFSMTANHMIAFFRNTSDMFVNVFKWVMSYGSEKDLIYSNVVNNTDVIYKWIDECHWCLDEVNADAIRCDARSILRVYYCAYFGEQLRKMYFKADLRVQNRMRQLESLIKKIILKRDVLTNSRLAPEVRAEPFVICLDGDSNVGKSHISDKLLYDLAKSEKWVVSGNPVFTVTPGQPFMNGYRCPKAVKFDDFYQVRSEPFSLQEIAQFFCFKSSAKYNIPMAELSQKEICANPNLLLLCTNNPFPTINGISSQEAFYRRRDMMVKMRRKSKYSGVSILSIPEDIRSNYQHVEFYIRTTVMSDELIDESKWVDYDEFYKQFLERYRSFDKNEQANYLKRMERLMEIQSESDVYDLNAIRIEFDKIVELSTAFDPDTNKIVEDKMHEAIKRSLMKHDQLNDELYCRSESNLMSDIVESLNLVGEMDDEFKDKCYHSIMQDKMVKYPRRFIYKTYANISEDYGERNVLKQSTSLLSNINFEDTFKQGAFVDIADDSLYPVGSCIMGSESCGHIINFKQFVHWFESQDAIDRIDIVENITKEDVLPMFMPENFMTNMNTYLDERLHFAVGVREEVTRIRAKFDTMSWLSEKIKSVFKIIKSIAIGLAGIMSLFFLFRYINKPNILPSSISSSVVSATGGSESSIPVRDIVHPEMSYSQYNSRAVPSAAAAVKLIRGEMADEVMSNVQKKIRRNTVIFRCTRSKGSVDLRAIGLTGRKCLLVDHMFEHLMKVYDERGTVAMIIDGITYSLPKSGIKASQIEDSVFVMIEIQMSIPHFCNIIKLMQNQKSSAMHSPTGYLMEPIISEKKIVELNIHYQDYITTVNNIIINAPEGMDLQDSFSSKCYSYYTSGKGKCMSVLVADINQPNPIIGFHVAGRTNGGKGYAECVVAETFIPLLDKHITDVVVAEMAPIEYASIKTDSNLIRIGAIPKPFVQRMPEKCKNIHSMVYNKIYESTYDFPVISPKDKRIQDQPFSPLVKGIENQSKPPISFHKDLIKSAKFSLRNKIIQNVRPILSKELLTDEDVVCGIDNMRELFPHLDFTTSEGFPYSKYRPVGCTNKKWLFDLTEVNEGYKLIKINDMVQEIREVKYQQRRKGIVPFTLFVDSLKDLKMPVEKCCIPGKTRIFSASPIDFTLDVRKYFGNFVASYTHARLDAEHAVGINVNSIQWHELALHLLNNDESIVTGDYKNFGPTLMSSCVEAAFDIIVDWYDYNYLYWDLDMPSVENSTIRKVMGYEMTYANHLARDLVYQVITGSPSGSPLTVIINNLVNGLYMRCIYLICTQGTSFYGLDKFDKYVRVVFYGDDLIMSVNKDLLEFYNGQTIQKAFECYNIVFTDSVKTGEIKLCSKITDKETTFLKRRFILHPVRKMTYFALGDERSIQEIANWIFETKNPVLATEQAMEQMLESAYSLGEEKYNEMCEKIQRLISEYNIHHRTYFRVRMCDWADIDNRCYAIN
ncbi:hypothetical protein [Shuangao insect virus 12]|uniref:hypothetical protein n=1 Tax=Shuangao insect virus 12 TaxID=1923468 RepID=UPI0009098DEC|nr:hypothetical protein [Shuangao insect virus 12]APG77947.1 hypothetical protein [Shuangao insect virus 12]